MLLLGNLLRI